MSKHLFHVSEETIKIVVEAIKLLMEKPRFGLPRSVTNYRIAHDGTVWGGGRVHIWITCGQEIGLRIFEHPSRPKRRVLRELTSRDEPPTLFVYARMTIEKIVHKLAQCIKTGLSRTRRGFINILRFRREREPVNRCNAESNNPFTCGFRSMAMQC